MAKDKTGPRYVDGVKIRRCPACLLAGRDGRRVVLSGGGWIRCEDHACSTIGPNRTGDDPSGVLAWNALSAAVKRGMKARAAPPPAQRIIREFYDLERAPMGKCPDQREGISAAILLSLGYSAEELNNYDARYFVDDESLASGIARNARRSPDAA